MRLTCASLCLIGLFVQKAASMTFMSPPTWNPITAGISFQVGWDWDTLPTSLNDGTMDILLVTDISASKVVTVLHSNVETYGGFTSVTVPLNIANGAYYIQLKVTSGNEKSAVNGPFNIIGGSQSSSSSSASSSQTSSTATHTVTNASTTYNSSVSPSLPTGIIVAISIISVVVVVSFLNSRI